MATPASPHPTTVLGTPNPVTVYDPNAYVPAFMPEKSIYLIATGGIQNWVASVPQCLAFESVNDLVSALQSLGYAYTASFESVPFTVPTGQEFAGGPKGNGHVPWIGISPVPTTNGWHAEDGAFVINAGKYADFWNHGVHPFVGSSYHMTLIDDIRMRMEAAKGGQPDLGSVQTAGRSYQESKQSNHP